MPQDPVPKRRLFCAETAQRCVRFLNVPKLVARQLAGPEHKPSHHMGVGFVFMVTGVTLASAGSYVAFPGGHVLLDLIGWSIHALGFAPYLEATFATAQE